MADASRRILLLGATGRTGRLVLEEALAAGHAVNALVRDPAALGAPATAVFVGSPYDAGAVEEAIDGCDAVVSCLNVARRSDNPWARLRSPVDLMSRSVAHALRAMRARGIRRIAVVSSLGVGDSRARMPAPIMWFMALTNIRHAARDHERQEELLRQSDLDWTIVRPALLTDAAPGELRVALGNDEPLGGKTSRRSVARFLVRAITDDTYIRQAPGITDG